MADNLRFWPRFKLVRAIRKFSDALFLCTTETMWGVTNYFWPINRNVFQIHTTPDYKKEPEAYCAYLDFLQTQGLTLGVLSTKDPVYVKSSFNPFDGKVFIDYLRSKNITDVAFSGFWTPADLLAATDKGRRLGLTCQAVRDLTLFRPNRRNGEEPQPNENEARGKVQFIYPSSLISKLCS